MEGKVIISGYRRSPGGIVNVQRNGKTRRYKVGPDRYWQMATGLQTPRGTGGHVSRSSFYWHFPAKEVSHG